MDATQIRRLGPMLDRFLAHFHDCFSRRPTQEHLAAYVRGLLSDLPRKSAEPIALDQDVPVRTLQEFLGAHRWDRDPGKPWQKSSIGFGQHQPEPFWGNAPTKASLLGSAVVHGRPVWIVTFLQPSFPAWFTLWVDKASYHTLELRMVAQVHFMHHLYRDFNRAAAIRPPQ